MSVVEIEKSSSKKMSKVLTQPGEKLEFIFTKSLKKSWLHNVVVQPNYSCTRLPAGEEFVLDVILKTGASIPFTATGLLAPNGRFIRYSEIDSTSRVSDDPALVAPANKREIFDRLVLKLADGTSIQLNDLDQAVFPLEKFIRWLKWSKQP